MGNDQCKGGRGGKKGAKKGLVEEAATERSSMAPPVSTALAAGGGSGARGRGGEATETSVMSDVESSRMSSRPSATSLRESLGGGGGGGLRQASDTSLQVATQLEDEDSNLDDVPKTGRSDDIPEEVLRSLSAPPPKAPAKVKDLSPAEARQHSRRVWQEPGLPIELGVPVKFLEGPRDAAAFQRLLGLDPAAPKKKDRTNPPVLKRLSALPPDAAEKIRRLRAQRQAAAAAAKASAKDAAKGPSGKSRGREMLGRARDKVKSTAKRGAAAAAAGGDKLVDQFRKSRRERRKARESKNPEPKKPPPKAP